MTRKPVSKHSKETPLWRLQAGKAQTMARHSAYSMGGLPREKHVAKKISLPKLKCLAEPNPE